MKLLIRNTVVSLLTLEARAVLWRHKPHIVAVTGNVGKTSTKDAAGVVFSHFYATRASTKSLNSEVGVPLAILGRSSSWRNPLGWCGTLLWGLRLVLLPYRYPAWLILEVGADHPGDIRRIAQWLKPDIAIVTRMSKVPVHVEFFDSPQDVVREKRYLAEALKDDGLLVLNYDDDDIRGFKDRVRRRTITYGMSEEADVTASHSTTVYSETTGWPTGITFKVEYGGSCVPVTIHGTVGTQQVYSVLAALAAGVGHGFNLVEMGDAAVSYTPPPGRMRLLGGIKDSLIIDDSYNSSPLALERALATLQELDVPGRRIAVLGDMLELGEYTVAEHRKAGEQAAGVADILVTVGPRARDIARGAIESGMDESAVLQFDESRSAGKYFEHVIEPKDTILVKGSQGTLRMEKFVEEIMAHPENKEQFLVRQEEAWQNR